MDFCAECGGAIMLRTGKGGQYQYYTCCTKARQGGTGCKGRSIPMEKLDNLVAGHIEERLLQPERLEECCPRSSTAAKSVRNAGTNTSPS
ncbi:zinc ribbon domain-containing protein [Rhodopila sp.]|uniref:zinc ribbon domain-containing protein n=1 Tax=Rhodopila sp. TaxID=2480087 RepID=UPI003D137056